MHNTYLYLSDVLASTQQILDTRNFGIVLMTYESDVVTLLVYSHNQRSLKKVCEFVIMKKGLQEGPKRFLLHYGLIA